MTDPYIRRNQPLKTQVTFVVMSKFDHNVTNGHVTGDCRIVVTHIWPVNFYVLIYWTSPLVILGVSGVFFHFCLIFETFLYATMQTLIRHCDLRRLIWVNNVCLCPIYGTLGIYGLNLIAIKLLKADKSCTLTFY